MTKKSIIYIDGFNLYYGALKDTSFKWLDLTLYFNRLRQDDDIQNIKYFTAKVNGSKGKRQEHYLAALRNSPQVEIIYGKFKEKNVQCLVPGCTHHNRFFKVPEEKRTDVNIGIHMIRDAMQTDVKRFVLVSGDSDLVPVLEMVRKIDENNKISVYVPARNDIRGAAKELRDMADKHRTLPNDLIEKCQFPGVIYLQRGKTIEKPTEW